MDDATVAALTHALAATPDNVALAVVLLRAHADRGDVERVRALLDAPVLASVGAAADRLVVARAWLQCGEPSRARDLAPRELPEGLIVSARACGALGDQETGLADYRAAIAASPALEDVALAALLTGRVPEASRRGGGPLLRVLANDDTRKDDVARILQPASGKVTFADVAGLDDVKEQVRRRIVLPFQKPSLFARFKKRAGGGILLYGPPGCGKTLLARAAAGECSARFYNVAISDVLDMYIGESERKLHAIFEEARRSTPSVLFFDELEALAGKRQFTREGTSAKLVSLFLSELDGFADDNKGVLVLGATNVPWAIDAAFRRPGRFDRVVFVPPPDQTARERILALMLDGRPVAPGIDVRAIAARTSGHSGADLRELVESACDQAIEASLQAGREQPVTDAMLRAAAGAARSTTLEWLTTARNYARYSNESGHYDDVLAFLERHGKGR